MKTAISVQKSITEVGINLVLSTRELEDLYHYVNRNDVGKRPRTAAVVSQLQNALGDALDEADVDTSAINA